MINNRFNAYKKNDMNTAGRGKIVVMLYSGCINFLKMTKDYINDNDIQKKSEYLKKATDIIEELNISLDMDRGQEIAKNLRSIYLFAIRQLTQVALDNNTKHIDNVISIITKLKNAFEEILNNPDNEEALELNKKEQTQNCFGKMI